MFSYYDSPSFWLPQTDPFHAQWLEVPERLPPSFVHVFLPFRSSQPILTSSDGHEHGTARSLNLLPILAYGNLQAQACLSRPSTPPSDASVSSWSDIAVASLTFLRVDVIVGFSSSSSHRQWIGYQLELKSVGSRGVIISGAPWRCLQFWSNLEVHYISESITYGGCYYQFFVHQCHLPVNTSGYRSLENFVYENIRCAFLHFHIMLFLFYTKDKFFCQILKDWEFRWRKRGTLSCRCQIQAKLRGTG